MAKREDCRVFKTRERLRDSLIILLKEKSLEDISISDICRISGVNRNTFYFHYDNIHILYDDVVSTYRDYFFVLIEAGKDGGENAQTIVTSLLEELKIEKDFYLRLFSSRRGHDALTRIIRSTLDESLVSINGCTDLITRDDFLDFLAGGVEEMILSWLGNPKTETKDEGAKICFFIYNLRSLLHS